MTATLPELLAPLLARGQAAFRAHHMRRSAAGASEMPIGMESVHVVTRADFVAHADLCLTYAISRTIYILDPHGRPELLVCRAAPSE